MCLYTPFLKAVSSDSLVTIKGYYITRFDKKEIENFYNQKISRIRDNLYFTNIDYKSISTFLPCQIEDRILLDKKSIYEKIVTISNLNKDTVYYIPTAKYFEEYIYKISGKKIDLSREICLLNEVKYSYPYYVERNGSNNLYKCVYIECKALQVSLSNTEENRFKIDLDIDAINRNLKQINIFFLIDIITYTPYVNILELEKWYPYEKDSISD